MRAGKGNVLGLKTDKYGLLREGPQDIPLKLSWVPVCLADDNVRHAFLVYPGKPRLHVSFARQGRAFPMALRQIDLNFRNELSPRLLRQTAKQHPRDAIGLRAHTIEKVDAHGYFAEPIQIAG